MDPRLFRWCLAALILALPVSIQDDGVITSEPPYVIEYDGESMNTEEPPVIIEYDTADNTDTEELKILPRDFLETNPEEIEGQEVFEGDMLLSAEQKRALAERKGLVSTTYRWPEGSDGNPLVPYVFGDSTVDQAAVNQGMDHWMQNTCIKFKLDSNTNQSHLRYVYGGGCSSYVGRQQSNGQPVTISSGCTQLGIVVHEIGHGMGFMHEQSRPDRDNYVTINTQNIITDNLFNFNKAFASTINDFGVPYDYSSDMHYGPKGFTSNGQATISINDPLAQGLIGQRTGLSHRDKLLVNKMYNCIDKWMKKCGVTTDPCKNGGYLGNNCNCVCPSGTTGDKCQTTSGGYYDNLIGTCTKKVTKEGTVTSPNYPNKYPAGTQCAKWIVAPECHVPRLTFSAFRLYGRNPYCDDKSCCYFDSLEIRTTNKLTGEVFCDTDISAGQNFTATGREMVLYFHTRSNYYQGWSAALTFVINSSFTKHRTSGSTSAETTLAPTTPTPTTPAQTTPTPTTPAPTTSTPTTPTPTTSTQTTSIPTTPTPTTIAPTTSTPTTHAQTTSTPAEPKCELIRAGRTYHWTSPNYGVQNYPDNSNCAIGAMSYSSVVAVRLVDLNLQPKVNGKCVDYFKASLLYGRSSILCGNHKNAKKIVIRSPGYLGLSFLSDPSINRAGFNVSLTFEASSCHEYIKASKVGDSAIVSTPAFNTPHTQGLLCHYTIVAPTGSQVRINYLTVRTDKCRRCSRDWVLVNGNSEVNYPRSTSKIFCGNKYVKDLPKSTNGRMYLAYKGSKCRSRGIQFKYTIV